MKKILFIVHGKEFPHTSFSFIQKLNELNRVLLVGVFLPDVGDIENWAGYSAKSTGAVADMDMEKNKKLLRLLCTEADIEYRIHEGTIELGVPQILKETKYADLLITDKSHFFSELEAEDSFPYLEEVLRHSQCPVLVVPDNAQLPESIILAFDGSEASVYAIKQFYYLFPELCHRTTYLTHIEQHEDQHMPDRKNITELVNCHFEQFTYNSVKAGTNEYLKSIASSRRSIVITGSYKRSFMSELFSKSFSEDIIKMYKLPVFIAHP